MHSCIMSESYNVARFLTIYHILKPSGKVVVDIDKTGLVASDPSWRLRDSRNQEMACLIVLFAYTFLIVQVHGKCG